MSAQGCHGNQAYSDLLILCALTIRQLFNLPYRATEGFLDSLIKLNKLNIPPTILLFAEEVRL